VTPLYPQKLALTSPTGGGRSVGIVRSRTKATEFFFIFVYNLKVFGLILNKYVTKSVMYLLFDYILLVSTVTTYFQINPNGSTCTPHGADILFYVIEYAACRENASSKRSVSL
jgi:hypothetical protein